MHVTLESNFNMICIPEGFFTSIGDQFLDKRLFCALLDYLILIKTIMKSDLYSYKFNYFPFLMCFVFTLVFLIEMQ